MKFSFFMTYILVFFLSIQAQATCTNFFTEPNKQATWTKQQEAVKEQLLKILTQTRDPKSLVQELDQLMPKIVVLSDKGQLASIIDSITRTAFQMGLLPERITQENLDGSIDYLNSMIEAQFIAQGLSKKSTHRYVSWLEASRNIVKAARRTNVRPRGPGHPSAFLDTQFLREMEAISDSEFVRVKNLKLLVDGPESFPLRSQLFSEAQESIYVMSWAFEDDITGWTFAKQLVEKKKAGVDVRIIVDRKTMSQGVYGKVPLWLKEQNVPIIFWKDSKNPVYAIHEKMIVVDGKKLIAGGMNFGDVYSHMGPKDSAKWRDTDFYSEGEIAYKAEKIFVNKWNQQVRQDKLDYPTIDNHKNNSDRARTTQLVMAVEQTPNPYAWDSILAGITKSIEGATSEVHIENAYFIEHPALQQTLLRALRRGVTVRIFTNSSTSIDVPIISNPIIKSLDVFYRHGAEIYLKKGDTLHSKFMTVDGEASWIMSYNHHPQSSRIQNEGAFIILDRAFTKKLNEQFHKDIQTMADRVNHPDQLKVNLSLIDILLQHYLFDQL